jgi:hypothetical protein
MPDLQETGGDYTKNGDLKEFPPETPKLGCVVYLKVWSCGEIGSK